MQARLETRPPFHLAATVRLLQRRPSNPIDVWEDGRYLRVLEGEGGLLLVAVENRATRDAPDLRFTVLAGNPAGHDRTRLGVALRRILGLDVDPLPLQRLTASDPRLRPLAHALRGMRPPRFPDLFESFARVVPYQQLSLESGTATVARLVERFGRTLVLGARRFHAFPTPASLADAPPDALRACGLSGHKASCLQGIARAVGRGELREEVLEGLDSREAGRRLDALPGIGPWSANLVLLRGLGRLDVFPPGDVGALRGLGALLSGSGPPLDQLVERFGALRGYLYFCALGSSLLDKGLISPGD